MNVLNAAKEVLVGAAEVDTNNVRCLWMRELVAFIESRTGHLQSTVGSVLTALPAPTMALKALKIEIETAKGLDAEFNTDSNGPLHKVKGYAGFKFRLELKIQQLRCCLDRYFDILCTINLGPIVRCSTPIPVVHAGGREALSGFVQGMKQKQQRAAESFGPMQGLQVTLAISIFHLISDLATAALTFCSKFDMIGRQLNAEVLDGIGAAAIGDLLAGYNRYVDVAIACSQVIQ